MSVRVVRVMASGVALALLGALFAVPAFAASVLGGPDGLPHALAVVGRQAARLPEPAEVLVAEPALKSRATPDRSRDSHAASSGSRASHEQPRAEAILAELVAEYPLLDASADYDAVSVRFGATPADYQAVAYYRTGEIVVRPDHEASLAQILDHEVGHVYDWRDNGRIDWGESPRLP